ncbi:hypothetical protein ACTWQL_09305 [Pseudalkalibacillus sp. R45]|uniref:hypothetical protein n=1 Tax=Pseudalkalibacillus sp. R45 TaxID=3457433 RepID=UPI003FCD0415
MKKQDLILKTIILLIAITVIVGGGFSLSTIDQQTAEIKGLKETTERQKNEISLLKNDNQKKTQAYEKTDVQKIEETVNVFVQSVFNVKEGNYEERKSNAESVLSQELFKQIFSDEPEKLLYEYDVEDLRVYTSMEGENASSYLIMEQTTINLANNKSNNSRITIEVFLQKEGEQWIVNSFQQIKDEPL